MKEPKATIRSREEAWAILTGRKPSERERIACRTAEAARNLPYPFYNIERRNVITIYW